MKKRHGKSQLIALLCLFSMLIHLFVLPISAEDPVPPNLDGAESVYFVHLKSGSVVCEKNAAQLVSAGPSVKLLSGLLLCEMLGNRLDESVTITDEMVADSYGYRLYIQSGDRIPVVQLLYAAVCGSYNDAYDVLACYAAGSKDAFLALMEARARELGASMTYCSDATGLDAASRTTAQDMGKIAAAAYQNSLYMSINSTVRYDFFETTYLPDKKIYNPNALLSSSTTAGFVNAYCHGMCAGLTGTCAVTVADNGQEAYASVVLGGSAENLAYEITNRMIKWVYQNYAYMEVISPDTEICNIPITVSDVTGELPLRVKDSFSLYLPKSYEIGKDITYSIRLINKELEAPVADGTFAGYVAILHNGQTLATLPLYTVGSAEKSSFMSSMKSIQSITTSRAFLAGAIFFFTVLIAWITIETWIIRKRRHKWDKYFSSKLSPVPFDKKNKK